MFIRMVNGMPEGHPILPENFQQAFPDVDVNAFPEDFAPFVRVPSPIPKLYEVVDHEYSVADEVVTDSWTVRPMSEAEIIELQDSIKAEWKNRGFASWIFVEETCSFRPPVPYPKDGKKYLWDETTTSWVEVLNIQLGE